MLFEQAQRVILAKKNILGLAALLRIERERENLEYLALSSKDATQGQRQLALRQVRSLKLPQPLIIITSGVSIKEILQTKLTKIAIYL